MLRIACITAWLPPTISGSTVLMSGLASQFSGTEMVLIGQQLAPSHIHNREHGRTRLVAAFGRSPRGRGERYWRWVCVPVLAVRTVVEARRLGASAILVSFPFEQNLLAGLLASFLLRLPLFAYFHNTYLENRSGLAKLAARALQALIFRRALHVFVMSDGMTEHYQREYPEILGRTSALRHTFDGDISLTRPRPASSNQGIRIGLSGSINESNLDAASRLARAIDQVPEHELLIYSPLSAENLKTLGVWTSHCKASYCGRAELIENLRQVDLVVLPHGLEGGLSEIEYKTIFPTRTIELLLCGRPILAHAPAGSFLARFLEQNECALVVSTPSELALRDAVITLSRDQSLRDRLVDNALRTAEQFRGRVVANHLRDTVASCLQQGTRSSM